VRRLQHRVCGNSEPNQRVVCSATLPRKRCIGLILLLHLLVKAPLRPHFNTCYHCGRKGHTASRCKVNKDVVCHRCQKRGHFQRACKLNKSDKPVNKRQTLTVGQLEVEEEEKGSDDFTLCHVNSPGAAKAPPITVEVKLDGCLVNMEVDTGASLSLM